MATQDTGLGWYADSAWLSDQIGDIGAISSGSGDVPVEMPSMTINSGWSASQYNQNICANGVMIGTGTLGDYYVVSDDSRGGPVYIAKLTNYSLFANAVIIASPYDTARVYIAGNNPQPGYNYDYMTIYYSGTYYYQYRGYHIRYTSVSTNMLPSTYTIPGFYDYESFVDALIDGGAATIDFTKAVAGYSVTCMCKWKTSIGGDVYCSPVLISSVRANTGYERNQSAATWEVSEITYQGMTFYMRKSTDDVLDGTETLNSNFPVLDYSASIPLTDAALFALIAQNSSLGVGYPPQEEDPYADGGTSGPSSSEPDFSLESDTVPMSSLPTYSFADVGFSRIYNPSQQQLKNLAHYLWTDTTFLQTVINHLKQILENPIEAIISLSRLPCSVPNGTDEEVKVMYIGTGVSMPPVLNQFVEVDCGTVYIEETYGSALDYNPYTKVALVLPFIGQVQVDTDEVMGKTLSVKYRVDVVSGTCVASVLVGDTVMYQYSGNCATNMPFNSADFSNYFAAGLAAVTAIAGGVVAGAGAAAGATGAATVEEVATVESTGMALVAQTQTRELSVVSGLPRSEWLDMGDPPSGPPVEAPSASLSETAKKKIANTVGAVIGAKGHVQHAGSFNGNGGVLGVRRPYAIITRPRMCNPDQYGQYNGRPSMMYRSLGVLSGYTEVQEIHLTGFSATNPELAEISKLLKGGVIL